MESHQKAKCEYLKSKYTLRSKHITTGLLWEIFCICPEPTSQVRLCGGKELIILELYNYFSSGS